MSIFLGKYLSPLGWIGPYSLLFVAIYFVAMRLVYSYEKKQIAEAMKEKAIELQYEDVSMKTAFINYGINAFIVIIAASFLPEIGKGIAEKTGSGQTFVGNIFIAISTSLPEVVVSLSAMKIDAVDLAIETFSGATYLMFSSLPLMISSS